MFKKIRKLVFRQDENYELNNLVAKAEKELSGKKILHYVNPRTAQLR
jgi:hypothetical protein